MRVHALFLIGVNLLLIGEAYAQRIVDPCFKSIEPLGKFDRSDDVVNVCLACEDPYDAADMMEWNGTSWEGFLPHNEFFLPPPPGCNTRAVWMGYQFWTSGGEGIALRLDSVLKPGKQYQFTFTYASVGSASDNNFSPKIYTNSTSDLPTAHYIGRLPGTEGWITNTIAFTAEQSQADHTWLFVHAVESSGIVLGQCDLKQLYPDQTVILGEDKLACEGDKILLTPPYTQSYVYEWSTGENDASISITDPGEYWVMIRYGDCEASDTLTVSLEDCEVRLVMPNVFTPNDDLYNERFIPKDHNFISSGTLQVYNRLGKKDFTGDLFNGWTGKSGTSEQAPGIYYYFITYIDGRQRQNSFKGYVTLLR